GADALLAARDEIDRLQSLMERQSHMLEHRADLHGELALAVAAAIQADADALGRVRLDLRDPVHAATVRAHRRSVPDDALQVGESGFFAVELGAGKGGHWLNSLWGAYARIRVCLQGI